MNSVIRVRLLDHLLFCLYYQSMTLIQLQKKIKPLISRGATFENFLKESLILQLQEINKKIAVFEGKYNQTFLEFTRDWKKMTGAQKHSYETEGDYLDWEALESYKRDLMRVIHSM